MEWTYANYNLVNYGICAGICLLSLIMVAAVFYGSKKGKKFVHDRVVGVSEDDVGEEKKDDEKPKEKRTCPCCPKSHCEKVLGFLFCLIGSFALALAGVLIFQACILANTRVAPDEACPDDYPMDCFIINPDASGHNSISDHASFRCYPLNKTQFPSHLSNATAQCFGWVISQQTTQDVLDQLGVCTGLLGLFSTLLALTICIDICCVGVTLAILFLLACVAGIILVAFFKVSFSPLTFAVLSLGIAIGLFGIFFHSIKYNMKKKREKNTSELQPMNAEQPRSRGPVVKTTMTSTNW